jgi:LuxR family maltose regulon positive regulatory protein
VLELLAKGYRNAEIVEITNLSINTVRYHTKIVYQKLDVNNAKDAVLRARDLGLID